MRKEEEISFKQKERIRLLNKRKADYSGFLNFDTPIVPLIKKPNNEAQVALLFSSLVTKYGSDMFFGLKIGHYSDKSTTDLICEDKQGDIKLVELEYRLSSIFEHGHPFETFDYVVCWEVNLEVNEAKKTPEGHTLKLVKDGYNWILKYGPSKTIPVIELRSVIEDISKKNETAPPLVPAPAKKL